MGRSKTYSRDLGISGRLARLAGAVGLLLALGACATLAQPATADYAALMETAQDYISASRPDAAIATLEQAAVLEPMRKEPWLRIAQLRKSQSRPIDALAAAEEVLRRDPADAVAFELSVDCGLQVALQTMQRLRAAAPPDDSLRRAQVQSLAALMSEVFGPEILVSPEFRAQLAAEAVKRYRAARVERLPDAQKSEPKGDPLDLLGGD